MSDTDDIERLILELHSTAAAARRAQGRQRPARAMAGRRGRPGRQRFAARGRCASGDPCGRQGDPAGRGAPRRPRYRGSRAAGARTARAAALSRHEGCRRVVSQGWRRTVPDQPASGAGTRGRGGSTSPHPRAAAVDARLAAVGRAPGAAASRARAPRRADRIGEDDDARGDRRRDQPPRRAAYRDDRGSDRVRAPAPGQPDRAGRNRCGYPRLSDGPARGRAPGARRHRGRRNARSGDDEDRAGRGRDRPPRAVDGAHDRRGVDGVARRRLVSARAAEHDSAGAGDGARRAADADAAAEDRRRRRARGRAAHGGLRRAAAHTQERAAAPPSGDHHYAPARVVHAGGVAGQAREGRARGLARRARARRCTSKSSSSCVRTARPGKRARGTCRFDPAASPGTRG